jgi:uncharacterized protein (UPF0335 family)
MTKEAEDDDLFVEACATVRREGRASNTFLQAALGIGTGRARKLLARMEAAGVISAADDKGARTVHSIPAAPPAPAPAPTDGQDDQTPGAPPAPASAPPIDAGDQYAEAVRLVRANPHSFGTAFLQRRLGIGYNAVARLVERMEEEGVVSRANAVGKRTVLPPREPTNPFAPTEKPGWTNPPEEPATKTQGEMRMDDVTDDDDGNGKTHNAQAPGSNMVTGEELRQAVEVIERIRGDKKDLAEREREKFAEMKGRGYDTAAIRYLLKRRTVKPDTQAEFEAVTEVYMAALGMLNEPPLFRAVAGMGVDPTVRESVIMALKMVVPMEGEITIREGTGPRVRLTRDKNGVRVEEVVDIETPPKPEGNSTGPKTTPPVPEANDDQAFILGGEARKDNVTIVQNPFPFGDARRRHWDEGWREQDGGDGFGGE